ncbi:Zn(2)-C6 fungal-type DNA-binding domain [Fusarium albosuccineum]|uniref:Zn(2)-C6 fungal-type DNA-binding domain n=1 Tax=Fusarium albosuccineum TaxID=1237068 RepID=A0A8H4LEU6_9HYPO|nr:Zn(2)-C6 fungal-type DNA-binding domain [Fusarium albosuccineum]
MPSRPAAPSPSSKLRPLLAAPHVAANEQSRSQRPVVVPKRVVVAVACVACRRRKAKSVDCVYEAEANETRAGAAKRKFDELQANKTAYERVFDALRSRSQVDAEAVLTKIRRGENVDDIARQIEYGDLLLQTALVPETSYRYEFPLSPHMPARLTSHSNPYLNSLIYELATPPATPSGHPLLRTQPGVPSSEVYTPYLKPYHAAEIIDPQLSAVVPSKWTTVCSDDALMRRLLAAFFLQDHDWWTAFHKDYFLRDMAHMRDDFCSALLVNALLALSCNYYRGLSQRTEFWSHKTLGYRFLAEAKRLWEYEQNESKLTTIHASLVFHIIYSGSGADKIGFAYMAQGCAIAHRIGLFKTPVIVESPRIRHVRSYTAWALYSWQRYAIIQPHMIKPVGRRTDLAPPFSLICFHYFRAPLVDREPEMALPDPLHHPDWYGEIWLRYPLNRTVHPSHSADVFRAKAEFAIILNELAHRLFGPSTAPGLTGAEVARFYTRFTTWYGNLPLSLSPRQAVLPSHLKTQLLQHPNLLAEEGSGARLDARHLFHQEPLQIAAHARTSLETLLRLYYLRHGFECLDTYLVSLLIDICSGVIDEMKLPHNHEELTALRSTVILLAKGIYEQGQSFFLGKLIFQLVRSKMSPTDLSVLERFVKMEPTREDEVKALRQVQMDWPVEITSMKDDPESKSLGNFVKSLQRT